MDQPSSYSNLKTRLKVGVTMGLIALVSGCASIKNQLEPYVLYSFKGIRGKDKIVRKVVPYWRTKPGITTGKFVTHAVIVYGASQLNCGSSDEPAYVPPEEDSSDDDDSDDDDGGDDDGGSGGNGGGSGSGGGGP